MVEYGPICGKCRKRYKIKKEEPPCATCYIEPLPEDKEAIKMFPIIKKQFIMGMDGPVSFCHVAIHKDMELYNIKDKRRCFEKLLILESWWLERIRNNENS